MNEIAAKKGHPKGLWVLFGTEMWERFNFYGMRAILTLFMVNSLMIGESDASLIYGGFLGLCYLTPMLGGFISDRFLGNRNCILLGGSLMAVGQLLLFTSASVFTSNLELAKTIMWVALGIIIFGNGFFKPNISSMVGSLYPKENKSKLDTAFTIFYMGINIGALLSQYFCPLIGDVTNEVVSVGANRQEIRTSVRDIYAFKWGFLAAGIAMMLGSGIFFIFKNKYVVTPDGKPLGGLPSKSDGSQFEEGEAQKAKFTTTSLIISLFAFAGLGCIMFFVLGQNVIYSLIYSSGLTLAGLILSDKSLTKVERQRIWVIYIVSFFIIFFWAAFEQAGSSLTFIADNQTDRNILGWNMPPSMVQIFNGLFVVMLAIPFSMLWDALRKKGKEPLSPVKQAFGLLLIAISYFIIAYNVKYLGTSGLLAVKWLILLYLIQTLGELCLSPIGLSLVGKLSPKRFASLLYGVFFLSNASGYALAGTLGSILPPTSEKYIEADKRHLDLHAILEGTKQPTGQELFMLAQIKVGKINKQLAQENNLDFKAKYANIVKLNGERDEAKKQGIPFVNKFSAQDTSFTPEQYKLIADQKIVTVKYPVFAGVTIKDLFDFFMVFVVLCGVASAILFALTPLLKKMMHGVR